MNQVATMQQPKQSPIAAMASRLSIDETEMQGIVMNTLMKAKGNGNSQVSNEEFVTFLAIANEYCLNPLSKEIYAFANRGAIQPIVSIDETNVIVGGDADHLGGGKIDQIGSGTSDPNTVLLEGSSNLVKTTD